VLRKPGKEGLAAGWAAATQANMIWLVFGVTVIFAQKINAQNRTGNSCLQKNGSEHFALELDSFGDERGHWSSICSLEKRTRWAAVRRTRNNVQCCSSVSQESVICQVIGEKNQAIICREMHGGGCGV
jgi:hypothetical protein